MDSAVGHMDGSSGVPAFLSKTFEVRDPQAGVGSWHGGGRCACNAKKRGLLVGPVWESRGNRFAMQIPLNGRLGLRLQIALLAPPTFLFACIPGEICSIADRGPPQLSTRDSMERRWPRHPHFGCGRLRGAGAATVLQAQPGAAAVGGSPAWRGCSDAGSRHSCLRPALQLSHAPLQFQSFVRQLNMYNFGKVRCRTFGVCRGDSQPRSCYCGRGGRLRSLSQSLPSTVDLRCRLAFIR
jgi:hypothetical protein